MRHRRIRQNPAASSTIGGMDTTTLLIGAAAGAVVTYMLTRKTENPSQGVLPAEAGWNDPFTKSQMFLPQKKYADADFYGTGNEIQPASIPGLSFPGAFDARPCDIPLNGMTFAQMSRRLNVPGRVRLLGMSSFTVNNQSGYAWLAETEAGKVVIRTDGGVSRDLTEIRSETLRTGRSTMLAGMPVYRGDIICDTFGIDVATINSSSGGVSQDTTFLPKPMPRGNFSKAFRR